MKSYLISVLIFLFLDPEKHLFFSESLWLLFQKNLFFVTLKAFRFCVTCSYFRKGQEYDESAQKLAFLCASQSSHWPFMSS